MYMYNLMQIYVMKVKQISVLFITYKLLIGQLAWHMGMQLVEPCHTY